MDDLISRAAAIDEMRKCRFVVDAIEKIRGLPSAQPMEDARAMCGECDAWNQYKNYPQPEWIPCSERLPELAGYYLVTRRCFGWNCTEYREVDIAIYDFNGWHKVGTASDTVHTAVSISARADSWTRWSRFTTT